MLTEPIFRSSVTTKFRKHICQINLLLLLLLAAAAAKTVTKV